ncbi:E3 ubiquitin-protein ligase TRAIP-like [Tigriopus californicus]|uniref:E3 ubiquitin-protein ligase TRAIP-like n=1 Tax=Tigriopus californicus TaxID=6832 RepID=UPI0027D9EBEA|nr:E3 ubiquitin-protein ligase TRAIP-like [Tigriopus californicus]XP_059087084.1 E3 ubiquitin-protein ligase TRAIP-like [Tigriopus californicus]XP_059087085.1 E3 ubiquitin-protein ligase TRAIP-like [Tigriopus californicus]XP_059087087.1 E3 ubiquitin-protein ligase TRAIP-like [Tigriopus californicus]XP_059087088.1 E3 ubiquitin-protein ligase TRAIP-like [Tigriopus californicus]
MHVNCSTCLELLTPSQELSSAPCGHVFHANCILKWLETGKSSCPQCRSKCPEKQLRRVYFTEGMDISMSQADPHSLQSKIDSLTFQVRCAESEKRKITDERDDLKAKGVALREEFRDLERENGRIKSELATTKSQLKHAQALKTKSDQAKREASELRDKLSLYQNIEFILSASVGEVNQRLHSMGDFSQTSREFSMIIEALKKEMMALREDKGQLRKEILDKNKRMAELKATTKVQSVDLNELQTTTKTLKSDLQHLEAENRSLKSKNEWLQSALDSPSGDMRASALKRIITESPAPFRLSQDMLDESSPEKDKLQPGLKPKTALKRRSPCKDATNYDKFNILKQSRSHFSPGEWSKMSQKSLKVIDSEKFYDGMGGHAKLDEFPKPRTADFKVGKKAQGCATKPKFPAARPIDKHKRIDQFFNLETP